MKDLGIDHFGLTVRDIERSTSFYEQFGATVLRPDGFSTGPEIDEGLGLHGVELTTRMLSFDGTVVELLQYGSPAGRDYTATNADVGSAHLAIRVPDIQARYQSLLTQGIEFFSAPKPISSGRFAGGQWAYFRDPDGISVELIQPGASL